MNRVGVLGFLHESNTFLAVPTTYENFACASLTRGAEMMERWRGGRHELSGMFAALEECELAAVPCMATFAVPSGVLTEDEAKDVKDQIQELTKTYENKVEELIEHKKKEIMAV